MGRMFSKAGVQYKLNQPMNRLPWPLHRLIRVGDKLGGNANPG